MRLSRDEHTAEEMARYEVRIDGELIPSIAVIDANEECFYARLFRLDAQGHIVFKANHSAPPGEPAHVAQTYMRYGQVEIVERKS